MVLTSTLSDTVVGADGAYCGTRVARGRRGAERYGCLLARQLTLGLQSIDQALVGVDGDWEAFGCWTERYSYKRRATAISAVWKVLYGICRAEDATARDGDTDDWIAIRLS